MSRLTSISILILLTTSSMFAQVWTWQNPLPQGNTLYGAQFVNTTTGYSV